MAGDERELWNFFFVSLLTSKLPQLAMVHIGDVNQCSSVHSIPFSPIKSKIAFVKFQTVNFADLKNLDTRFVNTVYTLKARMKELTSERSDTSVKQVDVLTLNDERRSWEGGVLGMHDAEQMIHTVFLFLRKVIWAVAERARATHLQANHPRVQW